MWVIYPFSCVGYNEGYSIKPITESVLEKWDDINNNHLESFTEIVTLHNGTAVDAGCQAGKRESVSRRRQFPPQKSA